MCQQHRLNALTQQSVRISGTLILICNMGVFMEKKYDIYLPEQILQGSNVEEIHFGKQEGTSLLDACNKYFEKHPDELYNGNGYYWESKLQSYI